MSELKISKANQDEMAVWKNLQKYPAWKKLIKILREKVEEADLVVNKIGGDREVEYTKRDLAILKKNAYLDLIELPEKMIDQLAGTGVEKTDNMDAYEEEDQEDDIEKLGQDLPDFEDDDI